MTKGRKRIAVHRRILTTGCVVTSYADNDPARNCSPDGNYTVERRRMDQRMGVDLLLPERVG